MPPFNLKPLTKEVSEKSLNSLVQDSKGNVYLKKSDSCALQQEVLTPISETAPWEPGPDKDDMSAYGDPEGPWAPEDLVEIPEPPDGGWGWVVVAASFLCNLVVDGIAYTFGIFLPEFVKYYNAPRGNVAWVGSLLTGCYLSVGPLVSALTNRFGCRAVTMCGSIISCLAFLLSTLSPNISVLMLTYGVLGGIGFGFIYLPAIVSVGYYFSTKRALATGIAVCGSGVGAFLFAPVTQQLLEYYDWKGALIILAGVCLNCLAFGALMRPLEAEPKRAQKPLLQRMAEERERRFMQGSLGNSQFILIQHADGRLEKKRRSVINMEPGVHSSLNLDQFGRSNDNRPLFPIKERTPPPNVEDEDQPIQFVAHPATTATTTQQPSQADVNEGSPLSPPAQQPPANGQIPNGNVPSAIHEIAKRKGLISDSTMKMSPSSVTMMSTDSRRSSLKVSTSGYVCPNGRNNNYLLDEVWSQISEEQQALAGSKSALHRRSKKDLTRPLYRKDIFYSGSIVNLPEYLSSQKNIQSYLNSTISIPKENGMPLPEVEPKKEKAKVGICSNLSVPKSMSDTINEMLDLSLLKQPVFILICVSNVIGMIGFYVPFVYISESSILKGIPKEHSAFLLSIIGITNTIGRIAFGWLSDRPFVNSLLLNNICMALSGICIFLFPFCPEYTSIVANCIGFGLFIAAYVCLTSIILVDLLGLDNLTNAFGLLILFRGAASVLGPPIAGTIFDQTGSYDLPFYIAGGLLFVAAMISFMIPCVARRYPSNGKIRENQEEPEVLSVNQIETVV